MYRGVVVVAVVAGSSVRHNKHTSHQPTDPFSVSLPPHPASTYLPTYPFLIVQRRANSRDQTASLSPLFYALCCD